MEIRFLILFLLFHVNTYSSVVDYLDGMPLEELSVHPIARGLPAGQILNAIILPDLFEELLSKKDQDALLSVITRDMDAGTRRGLICTVNRTENGTDAIEKARSLITEDTNGEHLVRMIYAMCDIPTEQSRREIVEMVSHLPRNSALPIIIRAITWWPNRKDLLPTIRNLFDVDPHLFDSDPELLDTVRGIAGRIEKIRLAEREQRLKRAETELRANSAAGLPAGHPYFTRLNLLLDTPLRRDLPPYEPTHHMAEPTQAVARPVHAVERQEAIHKQVAQIIETYETLINRHKRVKDLIPAEPLSKPEFIKEVDRVRQILKTMYASLRQGPVKDPMRRKDIAAQEETPEGKPAARHRSWNKAQFRLQKAIDGLDILAGIKEGHAISSAAHYQGAPFDGVPTIGQLFVLARRLFEPQHTRDYIIAFIQEDSERWKFVRNRLKDKYDINYATLALALKHDESKGSPFITYLVKGFSGEGKMPAVFHHWVSIYQAKVQEDMMPFIEALFMVARGHNQDLFDRSERNHPACAAGAAIQLLKDIGQHADVNVPIPNIEIKDCVKF